MSRTGGDADPLAPLVPRLVPLLGKLGSQHDGEVVAAARAIGRLLERSGLGWNDLGAALSTGLVTRGVHADRNPEPDPVADDWREMADSCATRTELLSEREAAFIATMRRVLRRPGAEPTSNQARWLAAIHSRLSEECV